MAAHATKTLSKRNAVTEELLYDIEDHVGTITLNRPEARNAWSENMVQSMLAVLQQAEQDPQVRALIITGQGASFCAGGDLKAMQQREGMFAGGTVELRDRYTRGLQAITRKFDHFEKPVIAAINGAAIGAGLDLALMADIRISSDQAKFGSTFASVGLIPGDGGAYLLTRAIGFSRAVELILTSRIIDAQEALRIALVHELTPTADVLATAQARAAHIAKLPAPAIKMAKAALYRTYHMDIESALQLTAAFQGLVQHTPEHMEAVERLLSKLGSDKR